MEGKKRKRNKKIELNNQAKASIPLYSNKKIKITVDDDQNNHNNSQSNINKPMIGAIKPPFKKHKKVKKGKWKKGKHAIRVSPLKTTGNNSVRINPRLAYIYISSQRYYR